MIDITPLLDSPALVVKNEDVSLVVADIHLGIEHDLYYSGFNIPSQIAGRIDRMKAYIAEVDPDRIILLGDIKHNVPRTSYQEADEVPLFLNELAKCAIVEVIPGNHDGGIERLIPKNPDINLHDVRGAAIDGVAYFHGHTWPDASILNHKHWVMSHNHPTIKLTDTVGHTITRQAWIRAKLNKKAVAANYKEDEFKWANPEVIIVPSFNELCGGIAFNESWHDDLLGPLFTSSAIKLEEAQVYLLDSTYMGSIESLRKYSREKFKTPGNGHKKYRHKHSKL